MHDPAAVVLAFAPELFSTKRGRVRVATEGLCKGQTVLDTGDKLWSFPNAWGEGERPAIAVALDVDVEKVMALFRERFGIAT
jgi:uridine nucleosidase